MKAKQNMTKADQRCSRKKISRIAWPSIRNISNLILNFACVIFLAITGKAQIANYRWATQGGGLGFDRNGGIVADSASNLYVVGSFQFPDQARVVTFGSLTIAPGDALDIYLAKLDPNGNVLWIQQGDGANNSNGDDIAIDAQGNIVITGNYHNGIRFGSYAFGHVGGPNGFVAKYSTGGSFAWAVDLDSGSRGISVATDNDGNVYVGGTFNSSSITVGSVTLNRNGSSGGNGFVFKLSPDGIAVWGRTIGASDGRVDDLSVSSDGSCYVTGDFSGSANFGTQTLTMGANPGLYMAKLDSQGNWQWARRPWVNDASGGTGGTVQIKVDSAGNVILAGLYGIPVNFGVTNLPVATGANGFIAKYAPDGTAVWAVACQTTGGLIVEGLTTDGHDSPILSGTFSGSVSFGPSTFSTFVSQDCLVAKCSSAGDPLWARRGGITSSSTFHGIETALDGSGNCYAAGTFDRSVTTGGIRLTNGASGDVFIVQMLTPPGLLAQPRNVGVSLHGTAVFEVTADGNTPLAFQWRFGGTNLPSATNASLTISNVQASNAGDYSVLVTNQAGSVTSVVAALTISTALMVDIQGQGAVGRVPDKPFFTIAEQVTLTATPGRWHTFTGWGDGPAVNPRVVTIGASNSYTAIFSPTTAVETLTFNNISRTAPVGMPAILVDGEFVVADELTRLDFATVSILTTFSRGSIFYTLDSSTPDFGASLYGEPFILRRSATLRAVAYDASFLEVWESDPVRLNIEPTFAVNATTAGGGTVGVAPTGASYRSNSLVTLTATPTSGWTFLQWLGDASGTSTTTVRVMNRDLCAQALFGTTLATTVAGGGSVVVDPAAALYPYGTVARLTAVPQAGHYFGAWGNSVMSTNNPLVLAVTSANSMVSCAFGPLSAGQVVLTVLVNGRGRVTTNPRANRFPSNQSVTLTALPDADQVFLGWSGDASGTATNLAVVLAQSKVITASFTRHPRLSLGPCLAGWREEGFQLTLTGEFGRPYRIEQSSGLTNWSELGNFTNDYGIWQMVDTAATNNANRFYRVVEAP